MGTLIGAPLGIALAAGVVLPAMVIGIPVYVGRQVGIKSTESQLADWNNSIPKDWQKLLAPNLFSHGFGVCKWILGT